MSNIALQLLLQSASLVTSGGNVLFDATTYSGGNIGYDNVTGIITFNEAGRYTINWWVATQSSLSTNGAVFTLTSSQGDLIGGNSPAKTGIVSGVGILEITAAPVTVSLINNSTNTFYYPGHLPLKAALLVVQDNMITETTNCFAVAQFTNILSQMITAYPATTWTVFSSSLATYSGVPLDLYTSPNANAPGLLRLLDTNSDYEALPIANILAIYPGAGTVYNPDFTYLPAPSPLPADCATDLVTAIQSYLPIGVNVNIRLGPTIAASGDVYRNEYGLLVLSDIDGNTPIFIPTPHILRIFTTDDPTLPLPAKSGTTVPVIHIDDK